ncbi:hypothetical protein SARC_07354 [Sphaeroforma arctica JP610]|uniref:Acyltransferase n=1 Tax=Sphaeroforma arctica JP610 TaxID=667725 RepID=A0A0L0FUF4_9EUKA|nr:hypothetical protein SARC_07354 [Sphaeroforma arctica JP610]KNC80289.1 hypothetical protein SARC_07354 [Sphaeroforma arctica JP610]|eukprot:XP_014154191.1 hypothetical protein SARC_07354 [Sphaeroforma arctica JP610]
MNESISPNEGPFAKAMVVGYTVLPIISLLVTVLMTYFYWDWMVLYFIVIVFEKAHLRGSRTLMWFRCLPIWEIWCSYFPVRLEKMCDLDPTKNYIFGYHPHGIICMGAFGAFGTNGAGFKDVFPGLDVHLMTLTPWFKIPFFREFILSLGLADADKESFNYILQHGPGQSCCIPLGGAAESLDAHPGTFDLTLADRKGFIRVAMKNGATLVPTFGFGETDLFTQKVNERGSAFRDQQSKIQDAIGFAPVALTNTKLMTPFHGLVTVVTGNPIDVPMLQYPTKEQIDEYHQKYVAGLKEVFDSNKDKYAKNRKRSIAILGKYRPEKAKKTE